MASDDEARDLADEPRELAGEVRDIRRRVGRQLASTLTAGQTVRVAAVAETILGMTDAERATLGALLADAQAPSGVRTA